MNDVIILPYSFYFQILELRNSFGPSVASPEMRCMDEELGKLEHSCNDNAGNYNSLKSTIEAVRVELKRKK